jgi:hypothetical protein
LPATHGERDIKLFTASALPERNQTLQLRQIEPSKVRFPRSAAERARLFFLGQKLLELFFFSLWAAAVPPLSSTQSIAALPHTEKDVFIVAIAELALIILLVTRRARKKNPILKTGVKQENSPAIIVRQDLYGVAVLFFAPLGLLKQTDYQQLLFSALHLQ